MMVNGNDGQQQPEWLREALKAHQEDFARKLEERFLEHQYVRPDQPVARGQLWGAGGELGWKDAIDKALELLNVQYAELSSPDRASSAGRALEQVAAELLRAKTSYGSYSVPARLERRKRYAPRPLSSSPRTPTSIREAILTLLPEVGNAEKVAVIQAKLLADKMASNANSVSNEMKRLIKEGLFVARREEGGRSIVRAK